jgi:plastocyanin
MHIALLALVLAACSDGGASREAPSEEAPASEAAPSDAAEPSEAAPSDAPEPSEAATGARVTIADFAFTSAEVTVSAGETVTFLNSDTAAHTVTEGTDGAEADGSRFNEQVGPGEEVVITFDEPGRYDVTCLFHPTMNMKVIVEG